MNYGVPLSKSAKITIQMTLEQRINKYQQLLTAYENRVKDMKIRLETLKQLLIQKNKKCQTG